MQERKIFRIGWEENHNGKAKKMKKENIRPRCFVGKEEDLIR